ncbi:DUF1636 domain-containing protein [Donghicola sp. C2-DW-16]|uniref:DUF1636 domain-containing protein n=1 Tax=Donghicola mangrovi TaxID=2729614 RepID=A0A850Q870_9RHOB|nr:DUF1636 domain-containing protein [Donghicola mangrovi]NVO23188.1 DUF1636 domain-containing protein [Donghicola mangrovi]NVO28568.1 DUF1636 domain-containing protein [Donghicola mangrovi]
MAKVTLTVCTTCRRIGGGEPVPDEPRPGERMLQALGAVELPENVQLRPVECLSACSRGCSIALTGGPSRWTYVYGDLDPETHIEEILQGVSAYAQTTDGIVPWRERPQVFRKQSIARIPPQE